MLKGASIKLSDDLSAKTSQASRKQHMGLAQTFIQVVPEPKQTL